MAKQPSSQPPPSRKRARVRSSDLKDAPRQPEKPKAKRPASKAAQPIVPTTTSAAPDGEQLGWVAHLRSLAQSSPALAVSLLLHVVVILALAIATIATVQQKQELVLTATNVDGEAETMEPLSEVEFESVEELTMDDTALDSVVPEMAELAVSDVDLPTTNVESTAVAAVDGSADGSASANAAPPSRNRGKSSAVSFYGAAAAGNRFAFIVDNSASMVKGRMLTTIDQVLASVSQMKPKQEFHVMFYSDTVYPMFFPDSTREFAPATKQNIRRLRDWLTTIELCSGDKIGDAMDPRV